MAGPSALGARRAAARRGRARYLAGSAGRQPDEPPGAAYDTDRPQVTLVPPAAAFLATFHAPGGSLPCAVYVDVTTVPVLAAGPGGVTVTAVDLDLDVVRGWTGRVWVDDEDEFAAHRLRYDYPPELVRLAAGSCDAVLAAVQSRRPPYDGRAERWLARLDAVAGTVGRPGGPA